MRDPLQQLLDARDPAVRVSVRVDKPAVKIGRDKLRFTVTSAVDGYVYVFMRGTANELNLLFPNRLDPRNRIRAGAPLNLPRDHWQLTAGGPPGTDRAVLLVSESPRDFKHLRQRGESGFLVFDQEALHAATAGHAGPGPLLAGRTVCAASAPCSEIYGAAEFEFHEIR